MSPEQRRQSLLGVGPVGTAAASSESSFSLPPSLPPSPRCVVCCSSRVLPPSRSCLLSLQNVIPVIFAGLLSSSLPPHRSCLPSFLSFLDYLTRCEILPTRVELSVSSVSQRHRSTVVQFIPGSRVATSNSSSSVRFLIGFLLLISSFLNGIDGSHHHVHAKNLKIGWPSEERETWEI